MNFEWQVYLVIGVFGLVHVEAGFYDGSKKWTNVI
jgi:hypothetical protein